MNIIFFILPLALVFAAVMVWAFFWAARKGQFDDLDTPPLRVLMDDEFVPKKTPAATPSSAPTPDAVPSAVVGDGGASGAPGAPADSERA